MNWSTIDRYATKDKEYAEETRQRIREALGFEPSFKAVCVAEPFMRASLKRFKSGETTPEQYAVQFEGHMSAIKSIIFNLVPKQAHLLDQETIDLFNSNPFYRYN